ncbi:MAG: M13-type metalloendopeptidase [Woeseiaceae bacterium]|nr:M13-type metalloendopeptidase [Woeseiaceae bacterium]
MNKPIGTIVAAALLAACSQSNEQTGNVTGDSASPTTELDSGVYEEFMDESVDPGDDFHAYVNGGWLKATDIPPDKASYGISWILHEEAQENVRTIIEESAEGDFPKGSDEQKVGDLFASYMDLETRNRLGITPLEAEFNKIDALSSYEELAVYFAEANKLGIDTPFQLLQYVDFKNPDTYMMYTWQGGLGLPEREYYLKDDSKSADIREQYVAHVGRMFNLAGLAGGAEAAQTIMALETRMAIEHMPKEQTRNMVALYNKYPLDELPELMPNFAWDAYIEEAGVGFVDGLVITQVDYTKALDDIIAQTALDDWKTFLKWKALNANAARLNEAIDRQNFEFYSKTLNGVEEPLPLWRRGVNNVNNVLGEVVGRIYVERHFPPEAKARMEELVANLIRAYEKSIRSLEWMGEETRAQALDKLSKFTPKIGYPDEWRDYSRLDIEPDDLYGNMQRAALREYERQIERQAGPVDRGEWNMTPQTVNAYYNPPLNEIVFPAAILQPPFFDMSAEDAVNYGSIGAVIGHEIGHGFDDAGSTFDGDGVLRNWWTDQDRAKFEELTGDLVEQYSGYRPFDDLSLNGEFTLGENIGDLGGLGIALMAYELSLNGREAPVIDGWTGPQRVFIGYAQSWRSKIRDEALRNQIATDPHAPAKYRTNGVVRNIDAFYEAFDVDEADALYLPPEDRVKIW